jgi:hypothetical protein
VSWYRVSSSASLIKRVPITVNMSGSGTGTVDVEAVIPSAWDSFWDAIDASANEMRVTLSDGVTMAAYAVTGFSKTNRTGTIQVDGVSLTGSSMCLLWLYYSAVGTVSSGAVAVVIASAKTGTIEVGRKSRILTMIPEDAGASTPRLSVSKGTVDELDLVVDVAQLLALRDEPHQGRRIYEEIDRITMDVVDSGGASVATMYDLSKARFVGSDSAAMVQVRIKAGTDATDYTAVITIVSSGTGNANTIVCRFGIQVRNVLRQ